MCATVRGRPHWETNRVASTKTGRHEGVPTVVPARPAFQGGTFVDQVLAAATSYFNAGTTWSAGLPALPARQPNGPRAPVAVNS